MHGLGWGLGLGLSLGFLVSFVGGCFFLYSTLMIFEFQRHHILSVVA